MNSDEFERLRGIGLTPAMANAVERALLPTAPRDARGLPEPELFGPTRSAMRVIEVHRETMVLHDGLAEHRARLMPRVARALIDEGSAVAVGDWVLVEHDPHGDPWVTAVVPSHTHLTRRDGDGRRHTLVSNVDTAIVVMGLDGDFNPRRIERYVALLQGTGITPVVVLTKRDVAAATQELLDAKLDLLKGRVNPGIDVLAVDATHVSTAGSLALYCTRGQTLVMLGSSGAGKSTLTNTLLGASVQDTGGVRASDSLGKHTTTTRSLHRLPGGGCVIDTPGVRTLQADSDQATIAASFEDIEALAPHCHFRDCTHQDEPDCAVRVAIAPDRLRNYHKLMREARRDTLSWLQRREQLAMWKARGRAGRARANDKRSV